MSLDETHATWATSDRFVPRTFVRPILQFTRIEASSGLLLLGAAVVALVWANSPWSDGYHALFDDVRLAASFAGLEFDEPLSHVVNDGLMAIFFFVVGLEIKRELVLGELRDRRRAVLPVAAALGGMAVPALVYLALTSGMGAEVAGGWAIPMATDIAFVIGVAALLGPRVPLGAKVFVLTLAIADDIGAIVVIALFYTARLDLGWLLAAVAALGAVLVGQRVGIRSLAFYVPVGMAMWFATFESGVHATLAGVALGFATPARALYSSDEFREKARRIVDQVPLGHTVLEEERSDHQSRLMADIATESVAPLSRLEHALLPWSSFVIVPLFALANAGVTFGAVDLADPAAGRIALGVAVALVVGKAVGISSFTWLTVRLGIGRLPAEVGWHHVVGLASLAGIGFTVSLFVTELAFATPLFADAAKIGIFAGSILAGAAGSLILSRTADRSPAVDRVSRGVPAVTRPDVAETIVCVDCGGRCHLISFLAPDEPIEPGTILAYRCEDCMDRWDIVWDIDEAPDGG